MQALDPSDNPSLPSLTLPRVGTWRILLGLLQGLLLYLLYRAAKDHAWPATESLLFVPLVLIALFVPPLLVSSLGHMPRRRLVLWGLLAALVLAGLGWHDAWRSADLPLPTVRPGPDYVSLPGVSRSAFPTHILVFFSAGGLFIAHSLIMAGVRDRRRIATYTTQFDIAWKLGVQLAFSGLFTGVSWLVLLLGAQLFELVKLTFLTELMREEWFAIPVTAFAFACAMHLTDVRPAIVHGIRGLLLVLMSWLLPVAVLLVGGFLASLPFTGLAPLWSTRHAASVLLLAAAALVVLINAAWQQGGDASDAVPAVSMAVRVAARIAALLLAPLVLIAVHALFLRVRDYGWTGDRVSAAACMLVALCYAAGYFHAALRPGWLPSLAQVNIATAFVIIAVLLALFSPLLDPARISVNSQLARLASGKVQADRFDFAFLRFDGERYGRAALDRLERGASGPAAGPAVGPDAVLMRRQIALVRKMQGRWSPNAPQPPANLAANLRIHPDGARLPESFLRTDWGLNDRAYLYPDCLLRADRGCDAFLLDVTGDGKPEVLLFRSQGKDNRNTGPDSLVLREDAQGRWSAYATLLLPATDCKTLHDTLDSGKVGAIPAALADVDIGGLRARLNPVDLNSGCRQKR